MFSDIVTKTFVSNLHYENSSPLSHQNMLDFVTSTLSTPSSSITYSLGHDNRVLDS